MVLILVHLMSGFVVVVVVFNCCRQGLSMEIHRFCIFYGEYYFCKGCKYVVYIFVNSLAL